MTTRAPIAGRVQAATRARSSPGRGWRRPRSTFGGRAPDEVYATTEMMEQLAAWKPTRSTLAKLPNCCFQAATSARRKISSCIPVRRRQKIPFRTLPSSARGTPAHLCQQKRLNYRPLEIRQIETRHDHLLLCAKRQSWTASVGNPFIGYVTFSGFSQPWVRSSASSPLMNISTNMSKLSSSGTSPPFCQRTMNDLFSSRSMWRASVG